LHSCHWQAWTIFAALEHGDERHQTSASDGDGNQDTLQELYQFLLKHKLAKRQACGGADCTPDEEAPPPTMSGAVSVFAGKLAEGWPRNLPDVAPKKATDKPQPAAAGKSPPPPLNWTSAAVAELVRFLNAGGRLDVKYVLCLVVDYMAHAARLPNVVQFSSAVAGRVTVVGDLHGKWEDILWLFHWHGLPSTGNPYIFNGDFVDRGKNSLEVLLVLFACALASPASVHLNRGNHEDWMVGCTYGFITEIIGKYPAHGKVLMGLFKECFAHIPLATVIDREVVVLHGGIAPDLTLQGLGEIDRRLYFSMAEVPQAVKDGVRDEPPYTMAHYKAVSDVLWSDPRPTPGAGKNVERGCGSEFGPDVSAEWLRREGLRLLVRSHECVRDGVRLEEGHGGRVVTVFSSSDYYSAGGNPGAVVILGKGDGDDDDADHAAGGGGEGGVRAGGSGVADADSSGCASGAGAGALPIRFARWSGAAAQAASAALAAAGSTAAAAGTPAASSSLRAGSGSSTNTGAAPGSDMRPAGLIAGANLLERSAVKRVRALVVERRAALLARCTALDEEARPAGCPPTGVLPLPVWARVMQEELDGTVGCRVPWLRFRTLLVDEVVHGGKAGPDRRSSLTQDCKSVDYLAFLDPLQMRFDFHPDASAGKSASASSGSGSGCGSGCGSGSGRGEGGGGGGGSAAVESLGHCALEEALYRRRMELEMIFQALDEDSSGYLGGEEFQQACALLNEFRPGSLTAEQTREFRQRMDANADGKIGVREFMDGFGT
jgi:diadenosine tetraphosphatase ApaH/serine/threonine PP2A family protein phosphatase